MGSGGPEQAGGWLCVVLFGLGAAICIKELLSSGPRLILSGEGLFDRSLGTPVIPWQSVLEIQTTKVMLGEEKRLLIRINLPKLDFTQTKTIPGEKTTHRIVKRD